MSLDPVYLQEAMNLAFEAGVKLEMVEGVPTWEALPSPRHQIKLKKIDLSVQSGPNSGECGCHTYQDTYVYFPDESFKRPDLAIYCEPLPETDTAAVAVPMAIVEILSIGYEHKDLVVGPPFYLRHGVLDVVVIDPKTGKGKHFTAEGTTDFNSPQVLTLKCGCQVTV